ncbi:MAG TPA: DUF1800 family protein [Ilumatobacteraceae bacterium]
MNDHDAVAWLHRRFGFGLAPDQLAAAVARGPQAESQRLLQMATSATPAAADPWDDTKLPYDPKDQPSRKYAIDTWLSSLIATTDPLRDRMAWFWHGHFVSALDKVRTARLMVDQVRLFKSAGIGDFAALLKAVTIDPAMLIYLDGGTSTGDAPNENYGREVMELFTLGVGNYAEADVQAGAKALTGYRMTPRLTAARFVARNHDDAPQHYLGIDGVHDVDTFVAAIMQQPSMPTFIAGALAGELLGTRDATTVGSLGQGFAAASFNLAELVSAAMTAGLSGASGAVILAPVPWYVIASRVTGATVPAATALALLRGAAQVPMLPPNVAGWPGGQAWFASGTVVARTNLALAVAANIPPASAALTAATGSDLDALAAALGLAESPWSAATQAALHAAVAPKERLTLALVSPEFVIA